MKRVVTAYILLSATGMLQGQTSKRIQRDAFDVVGLAARTTNADEAGPNGVIPRLWQRLMSQDLLQEIPDKGDADIYAVYTEYASDENGAYTFVLGAKVKPGAAVPDGFRKLRVPAASYIVFTTARGPVEKVVPAEWRLVWNAFPVEGAVHRAFRADFELYGKAAQDPKNAQVDIYVGIQ